MKLLLEIMTFFNFNNSLTPRFFKDKLILASISLGLILNIASWLILYLIFKSQAELIPIHYNIYFGIDLLGPWWWVFIMPIVGFLIIFINLFLARLIYQREKILSYLLATFSVFIQILLLLASALIIYFNKL